MIERIVSDTSKLYYALILNYDTFDPGIHCIRKCYVTIWQGITMDFPSL